jgi:hypothetical protein
MTYVTMYSYCHTVVDIFQLCILFVVIPINVSAVALIRPYSHGSNSKGILVILPRYLRSESMQLKRTQKWCVFLSRACR